MLWAQGILAALDPAVEITRNDRFIHSLGALRYHRTILKGSTWYYCWNAKIRYCLIGNVRDSLAILGQFCSPWHISLCQSGWFCYTRFGNARFVVATLGILLQYSDILALFLAMQQYWVIIRNNFAVLGTLLNTRYTLVGIGNIWYNLALDKGVLCFSVAILTYIGMPEMCLITKLILFLTLVLLGIFT